MTFTIASTNTLAQKYARAKAIKMEIAALESELANITAVLGATPPEVGKVTVEGLGSFTVSENNTYDETVIRENLSPGQVRRCTVSKLDKGAVKRLYPDVYAAAKRNVGRKVTIG